MKAAEYARAARHPVLRHLLRLPVGDGRVRAQRLRARRRRFDRGRRERAAQGDLQAARPARRRRARRHDAARPLRVRAGARIGGASGSTARARSTSGIATASSSTASTSRRWRENGHARVGPLAGRQVRRDRRAAVASRGSSPCSSTPSSSRGRCRPHPLFASFVEAALPAQDAARRWQRRLGRGSASRVQAESQSLDGAVTAGPRRVASPSAAGSRSPSSSARASSRARRTRSRSALAIREIAARCGVPVIFKASFDKANRTSRHVVPRPGPRRGPARPRRRQGAHRAADPDRHPRAGAGRARPPRSSTCCRSRRSCRGRPTCSSPRRGPARPVNVKKGQFLAPQRHAARRSRRSPARATTSVLVTERGVSFGYNNLVVDMRALSDAARARLPGGLRRHAQPAAAGRRRRRHRRPRRVHRAAGLGRRRRRRGRGVHGSPRGSVAARRATPPTRCASTGSSR